MYKTEFDAETGGIILLENQQNLALEYAPVYHEQMDLFHFDRYWKYEKSDKPYMWFDGENYIYRGIRMLSLGEPETVLSDFPVTYINLKTMGMKLEPIDVDGMLAKNRKLLDTLVFNSMNRIYSAYKEYADKVDVVRVAYSAGKDSTVLLDLVMRTLPPTSFEVEYTDTGMEFNSSIDIARSVKAECEKNNIVFNIISSEYNAAELWKTIGHPAKKNRWCCTVMKSVPSTLFAKNNHGKSNLKELLYLGNRAWESVRRSKGEVTVSGIKNIGTISCNAILDWNSAEVYMYIMDRGLRINEGYRKGLSRIGCKICPMASTKGLNMDLRVYPEESLPWLDIIAKTYDFPAGDDESRKLLIENDTWKNRIGGVGTIYPDRYREYISGEKLIVELTDPRTDWKMWMKTIGVFTANNSSCAINFRGKKFEFEYRQIDNKYQIIIDKSALEENEFRDYFLIVLRKACFCEDCHACESNCSNNCMTSIDGKLNISDDCKHCAGCHLHKKDCFVYKSQHRPNNILK